MKAKLSASKKLGIVLVLALFVYAAPAPTSNPGVVFEVETTYHSGSEPRVESAEMSVEGEMLKMEILPSDDEGPGAVKDEAVFRGDRKEMIVIDHERKSYMVFDESTIEEMGRQLGEVQEAVQDMEIPAAVLNQMPEEERKKLEELMKKQKAGQGGAAGGLQVPKHEYRKTGERGTKEGYPCVKYEALRDGKKVQELWVTDWDNVEGGDEAEDAFKELASFFQEMMDSIGEMLGGEGGGGIFGEGDDPFGGFTELDGIPVYSRSFEDDGDLESESVLKSARRQRLDPDAFEPPAGYKRMSMGPQ